MEIISVPANRIINAALWLNKPSLEIIWNTLICMVILGIRDATRKAVFTILLNLNLKRLMT